MKTLYACDLDGTLLDANARLSARTVGMLNRLKEMGVDVTFVTARTPATVEPIMAPALPHIPGVVMTGAGIWQPEQRRYQQIHYHKPDDARMAMDICLSHGVIPFVYTLRPGSNSLEVYHQAAELTPIEHEFVVSRTLNDLKTFHLHTPTPAHDVNDTVLFFAMGDPGPISAAAADISAATGCYASCYPDTYHPGLALLEVFTRGVSKAEGLRQLKSITGADRIVAFGDNLNDIPMLQAADVAVAMGNAHPDVKAVANVVIGQNTDDAVPEYIFNEEGLKV